MSLIDAASLGGTTAACAVCGDQTTMRRAYGDGHVPMCPRFCDHAWPNVSKFYAALGEIRKLISSDELGVLERIDRIAESALESNSEGEP